MKRRKRPHGGHGVATVSGADPQPSARQPAGKAEETRGVCPAPRRPSGTALTATGEGAHHRCICTHAAGAGTGAGAEATAAHSPGPGARPPPAAGRNQPTFRGPCLHTWAVLRGQQVRRAAPASARAWSPNTAEFDYQAATRGSLRGPQMLANEPTWEQPRVREGTRGSEERSWLQRRPQRDRPT